ncbi:MAG: hypothetical protein MI674_05045 [Cytophagales bacterium]|nr:hypothetical protein [Cytophagales bacterium]
MKLIFPFVTAAGAYSDADEAHASRQLTGSVVKEASLTLKSSEAARKVLATVEWAKRMKERGRYKSHAAHLLVAKVLRCVFLSSGLQSIIGNNTEELLTEGKQAKHCK